jgi:dTDP-4-amino-4,6-dideoxygalactose transaminase
LELAGDEILIPQAVHERHVFNQYVIRTTERDSLRQSLKSVGVETEIYYPHPAHLQECMNGARYQKGDFPASENACETALALPIYPELEEAQMEYVIARIEGFYNGSRAESREKISTFYDSSSPTRPSALQGSSSAR